MNKKPKYAFVVLNWNGKQDTKVCLDSLDRIEYSDPFDIIVVDNGSKDGSLPYLKKVSSKMKRDVSFVSLVENKGFTGGHIAGLENTDADIVCLLNNDVVVAQNILTEVDKIAADLDYKFGAIGGRAYFWNKEQKAYDIWNEFFTYQKINPVTAVASTIKGDPGESLAPKIVDNVSGACVFVNRRAIDSADYLDDMFFAYYEETDMFARFKRLEFEIFYCPTVGYWHHFEPSEGSHGASSKHIKNFSGTLIARNQFYFAFKNFEGKYLIRFFAWYYTRFLISFPKLIPKKSRNQSIINIRTTLVNFSRLPILIRKRVELNQLCKNQPGYNTIIIQQEQKKTIVFTDLLSDKKALELMLSRTAANDRIHLRQNKKCSINFGHRCMKLNSRLENIIRAISAVSARTNNILVINNVKIGYQALKKEINKTNSTRYPYHRSSSDFTAFNKAYVAQLCEDHLEFDEDIDWTQPPRRSWIKSKISRITSRPYGLYKTLLLYLSYRLRVKGVFGLLRAILGLIKNVVTKPKKAVAIIRAGAHKQRMHLSRSLKINSTILEGLEVNKIPIFINCRDRLKPLQETIESIEKAGLFNIFLIDNQSTYPNLLRFYDETHCQVILLGENMGHKAPWESKAVRLIAGERPYIVTDPDITLSSSYSLQTIKQMLKILDEYPGYVKIGTALKIDDLPNYYEHKDTVVSWEQQFWTKDMSSSTNLTLFDAEIDTTFAIYRPNSNYITLPAIRVAGEYEARHLAWYADSKNLDDEEKYYQRHASSAVNSWNKETLPDYLKDHA